MKKLSLLIPIFLLIGFCLFPLAAVGEEEGAAENEVREELEEKVSEGLDAIDFSELEEWAKQYGADAAFSQGVEEMVRAVLNGEFTLGAERLSSVILNAVTGGIKSCVPAFAAIFAIAVMTSMMQGLSSGFLK